MSTQLVSIGNAEIPLVQYQNLPVVTFAMIDKVHQRPEGTASRNFRSNRERFQEGHHFFYVTDSNSLDEIRRCYPGVFKDAVREITLFTERGYLKLVKSFTDDLAWEVQDQLIDGYFRAKTLTSPSNQPVDLDYWIQQNQILGAAMIELRTQRQLTNLIQQDVASVKSDIADIKASLPTAKTHTTVRAYAATHNIKLHPKVAQRIGRRCSHITTNQGKAINLIPDDLYGTVNSYPNAIIEQVFNDEIGNKQEAA